MPDLIPLEYGVPVAVLAWLVVWWLETHPANNKETHK